MASSGGEKSYNNIDLRHKPYNEGLNLLLYYFCKINGRNVWFNEKIPIYTLFDAKFTNGA